MGSGSIPKTLSDESVNGGLVCAHMHSITQMSSFLSISPFALKSPQLISKVLFPVPISLCLDVSTADL